MAGHGGATSGFRTNNAWDACPPVALRALLGAQRMSVGPMPSAHQWLASPSFSMQKAATTGLLGICTSARRHVSVSLRGQKVATRIRPGPSRCTTAQAFRCRDGGIVPRVPNRDDRPDDRHWRRKPVPVRLQLLLHCVRVLRTMRTYCLRWITEPSGKPGVPSGSLHGGQQIQRYRRTRRSVSDPSVPGQ